MIAQDLKENVPDLSFLSTDSIIGISAVSPNFIDYIVSDLQTDKKDRIFDAYMCDLIAKKMTSSIVDWNTSSSDPNVINAYRHALTERLSNEVKHFT